MKQEILSFGHEELEKEIENLMEKVRGVLPQSEKAKEIIKESLGSTIYSGQPQSSSPQISGSNVEQRKSGGLPNYVRDFNAEVKLKIEKLVDLTFHKGIRKAAAAARKESPFILDAFHDALTDIFYDEMRRRKLI